MPEFGGIPPRSPESFGVAGALGPKCRVYYDNLFDSQGIGRLSDVLASQLRELGLDEARLRALVLFGFFDAFRASRLPLAGPLTVECGVDEEKVAIGIAFLLGEGISIDPEGISERIGSSPRDGFEALLGRLDSLADHVLVRSCLKDRRVEIICFLAIPGRLQVSGRTPLSWVNLAENDASSAPRDGDYTHVGDLDYGALLLDARSRGSSPAVNPPAGELLARSMSEGGPESAIRISGVTQNDGGEIYRIKAGAPRTGVFPPGREGKVDPSPVPEDPARDRGLVRRFIGRMFGGTSESGNSAEDSRAPAPNADPSSVLEKREEAPSSSSTSTSTSSSEAPGESGDSSGEKADSQASEVERVTEKVALELQSGALSSIVRVGCEHIEELRRESPTDPRIRWMEGFMEQLTGEQRRLTDAARQAMTAAKQRQLEFRQKEQALLQESLKKDEIIQQKNSALLRAREHLAQLNAQLEKFQEASGQDDGEAALRLKAQSSQRMLQAARDDNTKLLGKVDQLKGELAALQLGQANASNAASNDVLALKQKLERITRQYSQVKASNEQLIRKSMELATPAAAARMDSKPNADELRKKVENLTKAAQTQQREMEQLKLKVEESSRGEMRLKGELSRAQTELKSVKAENQRLKMRRGSASGTPPAGGTGTPSGTPSGTPPAGGAGTPPAQAA